MRDALSICIAYQQVNAITWLTSDCLLHAFLSVSKLLDRCMRSCYEQLWTVAVVVDSVKARRTESLSGLHGLTLS